LWFKLADWKNRIEAEFGENLRKVGAWTNIILIKVNNSSSLAVNPSSRVMFASLRNWQADARITRHWLKINGIGSRPSNSRSYDALFSQSQFPSANQQIIQGYTQLTASKRSRDVYRLLKFHLVQIFWNETPKNKQ
jgi:hypothetical protein